MANLTIAIDDDVLKKARLRAVDEGTSVDAIVREYLRGYTGSVSRQAEAAKRVIALAHEHATVVGPVTWTREDLYDRQRPRSASATQ